MPPPTPVPMVSITRFCATTRPPSYASASAAQEASLSTYTGMPQRSVRSSRKGTSSSGRLTVWRTRPVANSMIDGSPMPTASAPPPR